MTASQEKPESVRALEAIYGGASDSGFGSAVFWTPEGGQGLEVAAREIYHRFVGERWERFGESAWMAPWAAVHHAAGPASDIVAALQAIEDRDVKRSVPMILDEVESPDAARAALRSVFEQMPLRELAVYRIGDGSAMSGLLLAGLDGDDGHAVAVVFLLD